MVTYGRLPARHREASCISLVRSQNCKDGLSHDDQSRSCGLGIRRISDGLPACRSRPV